MKTSTLISVCLHPYEQIAYQNKAFLPVAGIAMAIGIWYYLRKRK